jgi:hypothetical protein
LDERRVKDEADGSGRKGNTRRDLTAWLGGLGVAAAVIAFLVAGGYFLNGTTSSPDDAASSAGGSAAEDAVREGAGAGDAAAGGRQLAPQPVTRDDVSTLALLLIQHADKVTGATAQAPAREGALQYRVARCPSPILADRPTLRLPIRFEHRLAYVEVNREAREAVVYSCDTPRERLYSTPY